MERGGKFTQSSALVIPIPPNQGLTSHPFCCPVRGNGHPDDKSEAPRNLLKLRPRTFLGAFSAFHIHRCTEISGQILVSIFQYKATMSVCCRTLHSGNAYLLNSLIQHKPKIIKGLSKEILASCAFSHCEERRSDATDMYKADSRKARSSPTK